ELNRELAARGLPAQSAQPQSVQLGRERFLETTVDLTPAGLPDVRLTVLKSYDQATAFLQKLNRLLLGLGILAVVLGSVLVFLILDTLMRPLASLLAGVAALRKGDFRFPVDAEVMDE